MKNGRHTAIYLKPGNLFDIKQIEYESKKKIINA